MDHYRNVFNLCTYLRGLGLFGDIQTLSDQLLRRGYAFYDMSVDDFLDAAGQLGIAVALRDEEETSESETDQAGSTTLGSDDTSTEDMSVTSWKHRKISNDHRRPIDDPATQPEFMSPANSESE